MKFPVDISVGIGGSNSTPSALVNTRSVLFDGSTKRGVVAANAALNMGSFSEFSFSLWFKTSTANNDGIFGCWEYDSSDRQWLLYMNTDGTLRLFISTNGLVTPHWTTSNSFDDGSWHHVVGVYSLNSDALCFVDGVNQTLTRSGIVPSIFHSVVEPLVAGCTGDGAPTEHFPGNIDEISLWNTALTLSDAQALYNSGTPINPQSIAKSANLVEWWRMGDGDTHPTISGQVNSYDMTLVNTSAGDIVVDAP